MADGEPVLYDLEFENKITGMDDRKLLEFVAWLSYGNSKRITTIETRHKKVTSIFGGVGVFCGAVIAGTIDYFVYRH